MNEQVALSESDKTCNLSTRFVVGALIFVSVFSFMSGMIFGKLLAIDAMLKAMLR